MGVGWGLPGGALLISCLPSLLLLLPLLIFLCGILVVNLNQSFDWGWVMPWGQGCDVTRRVTHGRLSTRLVAGGGQ